MASLICHVASPTLTVAKHRNPPTASAFAVATTTAPPLAASFASRCGLCSRNFAKPSSVTLNCSEDGEASVNELRIPGHWLLPSKALEESEWLRVSLHKWLDEEYCPEETNVEISKVAAKSYYTSLLEKQTDLGEILLKMARELESISYQDSFHGAFSSANAAVDLICRRIEQA